VRANLLEYSGLGLEEGDYSQTRPANASECLHEHSVLRFDRPGDRNLEVPVIEYTASGLPVVGRVECRQISSASPRSRKLSFLRQR
jgi:hypothetical protein